MRCTKPYTLLVLTAGLLAACKQEPLEVPEVNTAPKVFAGHDVWMILPVNSVTLNGTVTDAENNISKQYWRQVSGQAGPVLAQPDSLKTNLSNLALGAYEFELTAIDDKGLFAKDTVRVSVGSPDLPATAEVLFSGLKWNCPMGCSVVINCLSCYVPRDKPYKVYLREGAALPWIEVLPEHLWTETTKYVYSLYNDIFWIYTNNEPNNTPDIKIVY